MICFDENLYIKVISTVHEPCLVEMLLLKNKSECFLQVGDVSS